MKILDFMSFNVEWFLTTQGMLITGGVLLLVIALVILLTSGKKDTDEDPTAAVSSAAISNDLGMNPVDSTQMVQPQMSIPGVPTLDPIAPIEPASVNQFQPEVSQTVNLGMGIADVAPVSTPVAEASMIETDSMAVAEQPVVPPVLEINSIPEPQIPVEPMAPVTEPTPVVPNISEFNIPDPIAVANENMNSVAESVVEPMVQPISETPQQPEVSIYGGVNPTQDIFKPAETAKPVIYGGADPLENTGAIPKVEIAPIQEQPVPEVKVVDPIMPTQPVTQTAVVNNDTVSTASAVSQVETVPVSNDEVEELVF